MSIVLLFGLSMSCGSRSVPGVDGGTYQDIGQRRAVGQACTADQQCVTGVCWDYADYDALCGGAFCSDTCSTDEECRQMVKAAKGNTDNAKCGTDGRCVLVGCLGQFYCQ